MSILSNFGNSKYSSKYLLKVNNQDYRTTSFIFIDEFETSLKM